jgi:hypothetical protein
VQGVRLGLFTHRPFAVLQTWHSPQPWQVIGGGGMAGGFWQRLPVYLSRQTQMPARQVPWSPQLMPAQGFGGGGGGGGGAGGFWQRLPV